MKQVLLLFLALAAGCTSILQNTDERALAKVYDTYLYESELSGLVTAGARPEDSLAITKAYIENWIRQQLLIHQAQKNLTKEQLDFSRQLENYQNSLVIFAFENELIRQKLDTIVSQDELLKYYEQNQQGFLLRDNIVQIQYVKLALNSGNAGQFKKLLHSTDQADYTKLSELCEKSAAEYQLDDQNWVTFNTVLLQIPIKTNDQAEFLKSHRDYEFKDSLFHYLVKFKDFRVKESVSPFEFEKRRIHDIIVNKRKIELLKKMQDDLYTNAKKNNDFEIF